MNKEQVLQIREEFFNQVIEKMSEKPNDLDKFLNQDNLHFAPNLEKVYKNVEYGDLMIPVNVNFFGREYEIFFTVWHLGSRIKIGVALPHMDLQTAITEDSYQEIDNIWGKNLNPTIEAAHQIYLLDWEFEEPHFFESYIFREKYVLGMRHLNFRMCRILNDKIKKDILMNESNLVSDYNFNLNQE